jgi:geranylgeranylglycerol-phosphate geranylgeranyltransferase
MSFIKIIRPFNCLFVALSVLFGAYFSSLQSNSIAIIAAAISATLIAAGGYVINDFFDLRIDVINKPNRILPSGKMSPKTAYLFAVSLFWFGIIISFFTQDKYCIGIAFINSLVLFLYAKELKQSCLTGNLLVAYAAASTFIFGGFSNNNVKNSIVIASFAFCYTLIREFIKDGEDIEGDKINGAKTLAVIIGEKQITLISIIPALIIVGLIQYFFINQQLLQATFIMLNVFVTIPLIGFIIYLFRKPVKSSFAKISSLTKLNMFMLLIIIWIGK